VHLRLPSIEDPAVVEVVNYHFNSIGSTVYLLFKSVFNGISWGEAVDPLDAVHPLMRLAFVFYTGFTLLCVFNIITGVFVENAHKISNLDEEKMVLDHLENRRTWLKEVTQLFHRADTGDRGELTVEEFEDLFSDHGMQALMSKLGLELEASNAASVFQLFDFDGSGSLTCDEFIECVQNVRGTARSLHVCQLRQDNKKIRKDLAQLRKELKQMSGGGDRQTMNLGTLSTETTAMAFNVTPQASIPVSSGRPSGRVDSIPHSSGRPSGRVDSKAFTQMS
jgi:hypothetical protein